MQRWLPLCLLWLLVLVAPAWSAITESGGGTQRASKINASNVDSTTLAFPGNVTAGCLLIVGGNNYRNAGTASTLAITDTLGTTYEILHRRINTNISTYIAYGLAPSSAANTVTVDPEGTGNFPSFAIDEFCGASAVPDVVGVTATGTSTGPNVATTTLTANDLLIGVEGYTNTSNTVTTPGGSYTQIGEQEDSSNFMGFNTVFRLVTTAQAYTVDWTLATSRSWFATVVAFREPPPVVTGCRLLQNGTDKRLMQDGTLGRIFQAGGTCATAAGMVPVQMLLGVGP